MKLIQTILLSFLISGSLYAQNCAENVQFLVVSTGHDPVTGTQVADYGFDPMWRLIQAPADPSGWVSNIGGPAIIVPLTSPWTYAGAQSRYINAYPTAQALTDNWSTNTTSYIYEREFCVCIPEGNPTAPVIFDLSLSADNWAELYLEDEQGNQTLLMSQPFQYITSNFINSSTTINTTLQLGNGNYKLKLVHRNKLVIMGVNLDGFIYSSAMLSNNICRPKCMIAGYVNEDADNNLTYNVGDPAKFGVTVNLLDLQNNVLQSAVTDNNGLYFFMDLDPGNYTVSAQPDQGWGIVEPTSIWHSVSGDTNVVHVARFLLAQGVVNETTLPEPVEPPAPDQEGNVFNFEEGCSVSFANVITPNGDGMNDAIYFKNSCDMPFTVSMFSRWGTEIFKTSDKNFGWSGKSAKGEDVSDGVYFFVYEINVEGKRKTFNGYVHVIR